MALESTCETIKPPAPDLALGRPPECAWDRERRAFWAPLPELQAKYDGYCAAI
jgi:hypothetical protein